MRRTVRLVVGAAMALAVASGCASTSPEAQPDASTSGGGDAFPVTVGSLTLAKRPEHIVSLSATATEMLFAIGAGGQVAAVDNYSTYPTTAPITKLSAYQPNVEAILTYQPDLVIVSNDTENILDNLAAVHVPALLAPAAVTLDDSYQQISDLGRLTGHAGEAAAVVTRMRSDIDKLLHDVPAQQTPLTYYYELDQNFYSVGSKTFIGSLFDQVGLRNVADGSATADNQYPQLSAEVIIKADPDLIFLADSECCAQSAETVAKRPGWAQIAAVRNGAVVTLDDDIASRWGPRTVDLLKAITDAVAQVSGG